METNNNINVNIQQEDKKKTLFSQISNLLFERIADAKWSKIFKVYFVVLIFAITGIFCYFAYVAANDKELVKQATLKITKEKKEENIRDFVVTPKIQHDLEVLTYTLNADRAFLFELHNGKKNSTGLPFRFANMTYEEVNEERHVDRVAMKFQDIPLTLYKYPHYLQRQKLMIDDLNGIEKIDDSFAEHIRSVGGVFLGMIYMSLDGTPLGFLCISYHDMNDVPQKEFIETKLKEHAKTLSYLLDLETQMKLVK